MDLLIAFIGLACLATMIVGLVLFLPIKALQPNRRLAGKLSGSGFVCFAIVLVIISNRPSFKAQQAAAATAAPSDLSPVPSPTEYPSPEPPTITHNYQEKVGDVYYYTGEADDGGVAKKVHGFKYVGEFYAKGQYMVWAVNGIGLPLYTATCTNPCSIIHMNTGEMLSYDPNSVIGAVFQDIMNGQLEKLPIKAPTDTGFHYGYVRQSSIYSPGTRADTAPDAQSTDAQSTDVQQ